MSVSLAARRVRPSDVPGPPGRSDRARTTRAPGPGPRARRATGARRTSRRARSRTAAAHRRRDAGQRDLRARRRAQQGSRPAPEWGPRTGCSTSRRTASAGSPPGMVPGPSGATSRMRSSPGLREFSSVIASECCRRASSVRSSPSQGAAASSWRWTIARTAWRNASSACRAPTGRWSRSCARLGATSAKCSARYRSLTTRAPPWSPAPGGRPITRPGDDGSPCSMVATAAPSRSPATAGAATVVARSTHAGAERRVGDALHESRVVDGHGGLDAACVDAAPQLPLHLRPVHRRTGRGGHRRTVGIDAGLTEQRVRREPADVERRPGRRGQHPAGLHHHGVAHCRQGYPARGRSLRMAANVAATGAHTGAR